MKKIKYTPDAAEKLRNINKSIFEKYGSTVAKKVIGQIAEAIRGLAEYEQKGVSVEKMLGISSDYRYIYVSRNYVFYRIEDKCIKIVNIYNEKEDFMWQLFGIDTTPSETLEYWE